MTITHQHRDTIEIIALHGKAIAGLLGTSCPLDDASREDLQTAFHALEGFFSSILEAIDESSRLPGPAQSATGSSNSHN